MATLSFCVDFHESGGKLPFDAKRLQSIRKKRGLTQRELANKLDIDYQRIQEYEGTAGKKKVKPGADRLEQLANALDTNIPYLMDISAYDGKWTEDHDRANAAFDRGDINTLIALIGKQVREQEPPKNRAARRPPRTKK